MRLFILDEGPDRALVVDIEALDDATWQALPPVATPISNRSISATHRSRAASR